DVHRRAAHRARASGADALGGHMAAGRVVVIDDDEWSAEAVGDVLKDAGFDVQVTRDGKSGLRALREKPDAVAVIDLMLPDLSGWQIVDALRADERTARIPVVTCTAAIV